MKRGKPHAARQLVYLPQWCLIDALLSFTTDNPRSPNESNKPLADFRRCLPV
jgi:hypothetical protein